MTTPSDTYPRLDSAINIVDSLVTFYEQESAWIQQTRAALELQEDAPSTHTSTANPPSPQLSPTHDKPSSVKVDGDVGVDTPQNGRRTWHRRKKSFKLRLEGLQPVRVDRRKQRALQLLEQFESVVAAKVESCRRVRKMISSRADRRFG